jgi:DNA replication protein DnaC
MHPSFDHMNQSEDDKKELLEYANNPKGFIIFSGTNGSGKSYAAEAIFNLNTHLRLPYYDSDKAIFINQADLNIKINSNPDDKAYFTDTYKNVKLLIIDDLGTRKPTDAFLDFLYSLIDYRWRNKEKLGTIVTTNRNAKEIREMFGDAFLSRVASGIVKKWSHPDRRVIDF